MGETAQHISKVNRGELLNILNVAFSEEWLAYYQYWIGAQVAKGPMRKIIAEEFIEHANEELKHAQLLTPTNGKNALSANMNRRRMNMSKRCSGRT